MGRGAGDAATLEAPTGDSWRDDFVDPTFEQIDTAIAHLRRYGYDEFISEVVNPNPPELITSPGDLQLMLDMIAATETPTLGVDCEIADMEAIPVEREITDENGTRTFTSDDLVGGRLRLVQLAVHSASAQIAPQQWLIDCFAVDASPIGDLLANRKVQKVIHFADFEQRQLMEKLNLAEPIGPIYDTCRAWMSVQKFLRLSTPEKRAELGFEHWQRYPNQLRLICHHLLGFPLPKDERESDWGVETLSDEQLLYATLDVATLMPVASRVKYVVKQLDLQRKVRGHIAMRNREAIEAVMAARAAAHAA